MTSPVRVIISTVVVRQWDVSFLVPCSSKSTQSGRYRFHTREKKTNEPSRYHVRLPIRRLQHTTTPVQTAAGPGHAAPTKVLSAHVVRHANSSREQHYAKAPREGRVGRVSRTRVSAQRERSIERPWKHQQQNLRVRAVRHVTSFTCFPNATSGDCRAAAVGRP